MGGGFQLGVDFHFFLLRQQEEFSSLQVIVVVQVASACHLGGAWGISHRRRRGFCLFSVGPGPSHLRVPHAVPAAGE